MIGVISKESETRAVQEFFQLFKTPWEFANPDHSYDLVIVTAEEVPTNLKTNALAIYNSRSTDFDRRIGIATRLGQRGEWLEWNGVAIPLYGDVSVFEPVGRPFLRRRGTAEIVGLKASLPTHEIARIGYDLFQEIEFLLSKGQPSGNSLIPTLEIHISLLRSIMTSAGIPFVEVPPVPAGHNFMACLTHDVDFTGIREHKFDPTMWGFIYRAIVNSLFEVLRGRLSLSKCQQNWKAVFSLPFVYLGFQDDFWLEFDRYMEIEKGLGSTFFFLPFKNYPGMHKSSLAPRRRAAKYDVFEIREQVRKLIEHGCEVGLHGIDAWQDAQKADIELNRISELTGQSKVGVRMHWLYFDEGSPKTLEKAGFAYDSTFGYNDAIGFRAGTTQAFCLTGTDHMLELPLNIQDTALFYPSRLHLSETEALNSCMQLIECAKLFGGALTVNWHTRSLSPERLWGDFYVNLLREIQNGQVWFGTAGEILSWFRRRREIQFGQVQFTDSGLRVNISGTPPDGQPPFLLRIYHPKSGSPVDSASAASKPIFSDIPWKGEAELNIVQ